MNAEQIPDAEAPTAFVPDEAEDDDPGFDEGAGRAAIGSRNAVHDKYQFESAFDFDLRARGEAAASSYDVDMYFYLPAGMGIDGNTYTRDNFYADLTNYLRIRTPEVESWERLDPEAWHIEPLDRYLQVHLRGKQRQKLKGLVVQETKLFGCLMNALLTRIMDSQRPYERDRHRPGRRAMLGVNRRRLLKFQAVLLKYRQGYLRPLREEALLIDEDVRRSLLLVDEYLSYRLERCLIRLHGYLAATQALDDELGRLVMAMLEAETSYRPTAELIYIGAEDGLEAALAESFSYRLSLLKKFVSEVLFLQTESIKKEKVYRNMVAACGAGLAASWAAIADFQRMAIMNSKDMAYRVVLVVGIGIVAYIFKDRIKELSKEYFNERLKRFLPDLDVRMAYVRHERDGSATRTFLGVSREFFRYLKPAAVPAEIAYLRNLGHRDDLDPERKEVVMHYFKRLRFERDAVRSDRMAHVSEIRDVVRFDMHEFLAKLSDPQKRMSYFHAERGVVSIEASKVYHVNVVFRYLVRERAPGAVTERVEFERVRIVLNKHGIVRAETVLKRGELGYADVRQETGK